MKISLPSDKVAVALSGGADSVALLRLSLETEAHICALHCNFHLRGAESDRDEAFVRQLCTRLHVALHVQHFETRTYAQKHGVSIEMAARDLRYAWFEKMRQQEGCAYIAVAHHQDDQAETVLLNLLRGTGLRGLAGMRKCNGYIIRPLLSFTRQQLLDYLKSIGQDYVTDSTNMERDALRNRVRLDVIPLLKQINPKAVEHIARTAERVATALEPSEPDEYNAHSLHEWLRSYGFTPGQEEAILRDLHGPSGAIYESPTHRLLRDRGRLILTERTEQQPWEVISEVVETDNPLAFLKTRPMSAEYAYLDADKLTLPLSQRAVQQGDRFQPFGMKGSRLVSDFLTDLKLNRFEKENQRLLLSGEDIVWVMGRRSDNRYRVTKDTRRIYCIFVKMS